MVLSGIGVAIVSVSDGKAEVVSDFITMAFYPYFVDRLNLFGGGFIRWSREQQANRDRGRLVHLLDGDIMQGSNAVVHEFEQRVEA